MLNIANLHIIQLNDDIQKSFNIYFHEIPWPLAQIHTLSGYGCLLSLLEQSHYHLHQSSVTVGFTQPSLQVRIQLQGISTM